MNNLDRELLRLHALSEVTASRFTRVYLKRTNRALATELLLLRKAGSGPGFIVDLSANGRQGYFYSFSEVLAFFGGRDALFHRHDYPELFKPMTQNASFGRPSIQFRRRRGAKVDKTE